MTRDEDEKVTGLVEALEYLRRFNGPHSARRAVIAALCRLIDDGAEHPSAWKAVVNFYAGDWCRKLDSASLAMG